MSLYNETELVEIIKNATLVWSESAKEIRALLEHIPKERVGLHLTPDQKAIIEGALCAAYWAEFNRLTQVPRPAERRRIERRITDIDAIRALIAGAPPIP
jgi:hypothetical protein